MIVKQTAWEKDSTLMTNVSTRSPCQPQSNSRYVIPASRNHITVTSEASSLVGDFWVILQPLAHQMLKKIFVFHCSSCKSQLEENCINPKWSEIPSCSSCKDHHEKGHHEQVQVLLLLRRYTHRAGCSKESFFALPNQRVKRRFKLCRLLGLIETPGM